MDERQLIDQAVALLARRSILGRAVTCREAHRKKETRYLFRLVRDGAPSLRYLGVLEDDRLVDLVEITSGDRRRLGGKKRSSAPVLARRTEQAEVPPVSVVIPTAPKGVRRRAP